MEAFAFVPNGITVHDDGTRNSIASVLSQYHSMHAHLVDRVSRSLTTRMLGVNKAFYDAKIPNRVPVCRVMPSPDAMTAVSAPTGNPDTRSRY